VRSYKLVALPLLVVLDAKLSWSLIHINLHAGRNQAIAAGKRLASTGFDLAWCSDLSRSVFIITFGISSWCRIKTSYRPYKLQQNDRSSVCHLCMAHLAQRDILWIGNTGPLCCLSPCHAWRLSWSNDHSVVFWGGHVRARETAELIVAQLKQADKPQLIQHEDLRELKGGRWPCKR
jgi:hypothetical protein